MKAKIAAYGFAVGVMLGANVQAKADVLIAGHAKPVLQSESSSVF
jgi:hypothetical protein